MPTSTIFWNYQEQSLGYFKKHKLDIKTRRIFFFGSDLRNAALNNCSGCSKFLFKLPRFVRRRGFISTSDTSACNQEVLREVWDSLNNSYFLMEMGLLGSQAHGRFRLVNRVLTFRLHEKAKFCWFMTISVKWRHFLFMAMFDEKGNIKTRNVFPGWPVYGVKCLCYRGWEWEREGSHSY